MITIKY